MHLDVLRANTTCEIWASIDFIMLYNAANEHTTSVEAVLADVSKSWQTNNLLVSRGHLGTICIHSGPGHEQAGLFDLGGFCPTAFRALAVLTVQISSDFGNHVHIPYQRIPYVEPSSLVFAFLRSAFAGRHAVYDLLVSLICHIRSRIITGVNELLQPGCDARLHTAWYVGFCVPLGCSVCICLSVQTVKAMAVTCRMVSAAVGQWWCNASSKGLCHNTLLMQRAATCVPYTTVRCITFYWQVVLAFVPIGHASISCGNICVVWYG